MLSKFKNKKKCVFITLSLLSVFVFIFNVLPASAGFGFGGEDSCTNILVGTHASADGSAISSYSCDGARYAKVKYILSKKHKPGTMIPVYYDPGVSSYETYLDYMEYMENPQIIGQIPQARQTYGFTSLRVWYEDEQVGGVNEYGLTIGETTIGGRRELRNSNGLIYTYASGLKGQQNSLMTLALQRAKTARKAIQVMGSLAEEYGYIQSGEHITINDGNEVWAFEIFGPGTGWTPGCGEPGAVWCAQRIPDGHVGVSANRSRIGEINLDDNNNFMASPNVYSLALNNGWWDGVTTFVWYETYAPSEKLSSITREWAVLNNVAPSLGLPMPSEVGDTRYPFSVIPDGKVSAQDVIAMHRYAFEGTDYDVTENEVFYVDGKKSPMASQFGPSDLHNLLGVSPMRSPGNTSAVFCYVSQVRDWMPDPIKACFWLGMGPSPTSCFVPIYSGVTKFPDAWTHTNLTAVDRSEAWWGFNLANTLPMIKWQPSIEDIKGVRDPAEATFFNQQSEMEDNILNLYTGKSKKHVEKLARKLVTQYSSQCMEAASDAYWDLADFLLFKYYFLRSYGAPQELPVIDCPSVPTR